MILTIKINLWVHFRKNFTTNVVGNPHAAEANLCSWAAPDRAIANGRDEGYIKLHFDDSPASDAWAILGRDGEGGARQLHGFAACAKVAQTLRSGTPKRNRPMRIKSESSQWAGIMTVVAVLTTGFVGTYLYLMWQAGRAMSLLAVGIGFIACALIGRAVISSSISLF